MVLAGEAERTEALTEALAVITGTNRTARPEGVSVPHAGELRDLGIAIEKAGAAMKLLFAGRASEGQGERTAAADLARKSGTSVKKAAAALESSKQLRDQPAVEDAVRNGELSEDQTTAITDAVDKNPTAAPKLLKEAQQGSMRGLKDACGKAKADADADEEATHARNHARRSWRTTTETDGAFAGFLRSTTRCGADLSAFMDPFRKQVLDRNKAAGVRDPFEAVEHDALMAMAAAAHRNVTGGAAGTETGGGDPDGGSGGGAAVKPPATVYVVADFDRLVGRHSNDTDSAYMPGYGNVPTSVVREILADAFLVGVVMKGTEVAKIKRWGKHIPAEIRDALMIEHRFKCSNPGCDNWARLQIDHTHPRAKGGETSKANNKPLCTPCHQEKSEQDRLMWDDIPYRDTS